MNATIRLNLRHPLLLLGLAALAIAAFMTIRSRSAARKATQNTQELARVAETATAATPDSPALTSTAASSENNAVAPASFPAWQAPADVFASPAPARIGMLVVTAIEDPEGDYESLKQIRAMDAQGIRLTYHGAKPTENGQYVADLDRLVLKQDLDHSHSYAQLFGKTQPLSIPGTTAISASREVLAELSEKGTSEFSFQPDGIRGAVGNMVSMLSSFGGISGKDLGSAELDKISKLHCTLQREGTGLFAFPVLLDDRPATLPALHAGCPTDDGPAEFYILNQPDYPLMLAWKSGSGSQLQVTKISYPPSTKASDAPASTHIERQLEENKKVEVYGIYFNFGSDHLKPESEPVLKEIGAVLSAHPDWKLKVSGHTDNVGADDANLDLSARRSAAVKAALVSRYHVPPAALDTEGFGASQPVDTNATLAGRARNRRVELVRE